MALLKAANYLQDSDEIQEFPLDFLDVPEGFEIPVLVITVNDAVRERAGYALQKYGGNPEVHGLQQSDQFLIIKNDPVGYCKHILQKAYKDCIDLFDTPSKKVFLNLLSRKPAFARALGSLFLTFFAGDDLLKKTQKDEDKKNSDGS